MFELREAGDCLLCVTVSKTDLHLLKFEMAEYIRVNLQSSS